MGPSRASTATSDPRTPDRPPAANVDDWDTGGSLASCSPAARLPPDLTSRSQTNPVSPCQPNRGLARSPRFRPTTPPAKLPNITLTFRVTREPSVGTGLGAALLNPQSEPIDRPVSPSLPPLREVRKPDIRVPSPRHLMVPSPAGIPQILRTRGEAALGRRSSVLPQ